MEHFTNIYNLLTSLSACILLSISIVTIVRKKAVYTERTALLLVFISSLTAMVGSLIYSNVIGFAPCDLCWYQRIAMYPIALISGLAYFRKDTHVFPFIKLLAFVGGGISVFHNIIYYTNINPFPCSATASCTARYVYEFGFMTIPLMALSFFVFILTALYYRNPSVQQ